eukprot:1026471-Pyramimonas_sp.AAC.1
MILGNAVADVLAGAAAARVQRVKTQSRAVGAQGAFRQTSPTPRNGLCFRTREGTGTRGADTL